MFHALRRRCCASEAIAQLLPHRTSSCASLDKHARKLQLEMRPDGVKDERGRRATDVGDGDGRDAARGNDDEAPFERKDEAREGGMDVEGGKEDGRRGGACRWIGRSEAKSG